MPTLMDGIRRWLAWILLALVILGFVVFYFLAVAPVKHRVNNIHTFLGTNRGPESSWSGLMKRWEENNKFHRQEYTKIECTLWKIQHPTDSLVMRPEDPCPPPGPSTKPPGGPVYP